MLSRCVYYDLYGFNKLCSCFPNYVLFRLIPSELHLSQSQDLTSCKQLQYQQPNEKGVFIFWIKFSRLMWDKYGPAHPWTNAKVIL